MVFEAMKPYISWQLENGFDMLMEGRFRAGFDNLCLGILKGLDKQASIGVVMVLTTLSVNVALPLAFVWLGVDVFWIVFLYSLNVMVRALV